MSLKLLQSNYKSVEEKHREQEEKQKFNVDKFNQLKEQIKSRERERSEKKKQDDEKFKEVMKRKPLYEEIE